VNHLSPIDRLATAIGFVTAFVVALPIASIVWLALTPPDDVWGPLFAYVLPQALRDTAMLLAGVGIVALLAGAGPAWLVSRYDFSGRLPVSWLLPLPLAIPTYIAAYVYVDLFEPLGAVHRLLSLAMSPQQAVAHLPQLRSLPGAAAILGLVLSPYVYLAARAAFAFQSAACAEAARVLGASRWVTFWRVMLPPAWPAIVVGLALVALETLNDIGASEYLGVRTLTVSIFTTWLNRGSLSGAAQLSVAMLIAVALIALAEWRSRRKVAPEIGGDSPQTLPRRPLRGAKAAFAFAACALPMLFGFIVPLIYLIDQSIRRALVDGAGSLLRDAAHSVLYAAIATIISLFVALAIVFALRWRPRRATTMAAAVAHTGYAVPGLVLALGLLPPVLAGDNLISAVAVGLGLPKPGLVMVGSGAAVVIAYVIRFLAVALGFLAAGVARIPRDYDDSAAVAGAARLTTLCRIDLPLLKPALTGAAIVTFVDCLKELPATLLLRPLNTETLATSIYQYASRGSFEEGALAALLIVAASIPPVIWLTRLTDMPQGPA
jgi:iron(III) transport system permease protein